MTSVPVALSVDSRTSAGPKTPEAGRTSSARPSAEAAHERCAWTRSGNSTESLWIGCSSKRAALSWPSNAGGWLGGVAEAGVSAVPLSEEKLRSPQTQSGWSERRRATTAVGLSVVDRMGCFCVVWAVKVDLPFIYLLICALTVVSFRRWRLSLQNCMATSFAGEKIVFTGSPKSDWLIYLFIYLLT